MSRLHQHIPIKARRHTIRQHIAQHITHLIVGIATATHVIHHRQHILRHLALHRHEPLFCLHRLLWQVAHRNIGWCKVAKPFFSERNGFFKFNMARNAKYQIVDGIMLCEKRLDILMRGVFNVINRKSNGGPAVWVHFISQIVAKVI